MPSPPPVSLLFLLLTAACAPAPKPASSPQDLTDQAKAVARELRPFGYEIDFERLRVELCTPAELRERERRRRELTETPRRQVEHFLSDALGSRDGSSWEEQIEEVVELLTACYLPDTKTVVIVDAPGRVAESMDPDLMLAHELVHAWREQQSGLFESLRLGDATTELQRIGQCIGEGEATFAELSLKLTRAGGAPEDLSLDSPDNPLGHYLHSELGTPAYSRGARLALLCWQRGGWRAVRGFWDEHPSSTEQILHLAKLGADLPRTVELPDWPPSAGTYELVGDDCLGELGTFWLLYSTSPGGRTSWYAATGWDGDRARLYRNADGDAALIWRSLWDRELDAEQFAARLARTDEGRWRIHERVVDFAWTTDGALATELLDWLEGELVVPEEDTEDARSTAEEEARRSAEEESAPYRSSQGSWVHPRHGLTLSLPEGWEAVDTDGYCELLECSTGHPTGTGLVVGMPSLAGLDPGELLEVLAREPRRLGVVPDVLEKVERGGREAVWIRFDGPADFPAQTTRLVLPDEREPVVITATLGPSSSRAAKQRVAELFEGIRFELEPREVPEPDLEQLFEPEPPPAGKPPVVRVLDEATGEPLAGVEVWVVDPCWLLLASALPETAEHEERVHRRGQWYRTDDEGRAKLPAFRQRRWLGARRGERFDYTWYEPELDRPLELHLASAPSGAPEVAPGEIALAGVVVDEFGAPVGGADCRLVGSRSRRARTRTAEDGSFRFAVPWNESATLDVLAPYHEPCVGERVTPGDSNVKVQLYRTLDPAGVSGSLILPGPCPSDSPEGDALDCPRIRVFRPGGGENTRAHVVCSVTDDGLAFCLDYLGPGDHELRVYLPDGSLAAEPIAISLAPRERRELEPIDLRELVTQVAVRLVDSAGKGVPGEVRQRKTKDQETFFTVPVPDDGRITLFSTREALELEVSAPGYRPLHFPSVTGDLEIVMRPPIPVQLRLDREVRLPMEELFLTAQLAPVRSEDEEVAAGDARTMTGSARFTDGVAELAVNGPGTWCVSWKLERSDRWKDRTRSFLGEADNPHVEVLDLDRTQVLVVSPPSQEAIDGLVEKLGG